MKRFLIAVIVILFLILLVKIAKKTEREFPTGKTMYTTASLNVRDLPSTYRSEVIAVLPINSEIFVSDSLFESRQSDIVWRQVWTIDTIYMGYVSSRYLSSIKTSEVTDATPAGLSEEKFEGVSPTNPIIELSVLSKKNNTIEFTVNTNLPLPIEVMLSLDATGGEPSDPYIGRVKRVTIDSTPFIYQMAATLDAYEPMQEFLPTGKYNANVTFNPKWGAEKGSPHAKAISTKISDSKEIQLEKASSIEELRDRMKKRYWGTDLIFGDTWSRREFIKNMGNYEKLVVANNDPNIIKVYYFRDADMTLFVSKPLNQVMRWVYGKHNQY